MRREPVRAGELDDLPEAAFYLVGNIDQVKAKAEGRLRAGNDHPIAGSEIAGVGRDAVRSPGAAPRPGQVLIMRENLDVKQANSKQQEHDGHGYGEEPQRPRPEVRFRRGLVRAQLRGLALHRVDLLLN